MKTIPTRSKAVARSRWLIIGLVVAAYALVVFGLLAALSCDAQAAEPGFKLASLAFGAGVFADAWTSERGFDAGFLESNPTLPARPTDSRFFVQVALCDGAVYYAAWKLRENHPRAARWILIGAAIVHTAAAVHNDRLYDESR